MNRLIQVRKATPLCLVAMACFGLLPVAQAQLPPPAPDGGYPGANTAEGTRALFNRTTGINNTATGFEALFKDTTGSFNTAIGLSALHENNGDSNTATGHNALKQNQTGVENTATGTAALRENITGNHNTADGFTALLKNTTGVENTATGAGALRENIDGNHNTADGFQALFRNTTGDVPGGVQSGEDNTANGYRALRNNTIGQRNTAVGFQALLHNSETADLTDQGNLNSAFGAAALSTNDSGSFNTAIGSLALAAGKGHVGDTAVGTQALQNLEGKAVADLLAPDNNIALGFAAGFNLKSGSDNIYIGNLGPPAPAPSPLPSPTPGVEVGTIRIGAGQSATFIAGIRDATTGIADAMPVVIDSAGQLGTASSSQRFKNEIKPMEKMSEAILALNPVTFHFKSDSKRTPQFGLIAEEVAKVNPDLVVRDKNGEIYSVRYDAVNAMLLNEFLKEHKKVKQLEGTIATLAATVKEQAAQIQKVNAQLEVSKSAPQTVLNNR
jgi:trimeric autotransporter adhesin